MSPKVIRFPIHAIKQSVNFPCRSSLFCVESTLHLIIRYECRETWCQVCGVICQCDDQLFVQFHMTVEYLGTQSSSLYICVGVEGPYCASQCIQRERNESQTHTRARTALCETEKKTINIVLILARQGKRGKGVTLTLNFNIELGPTNAGYFSPSPG